MALSERTLTNTPQQNGEARHGDVVALCALLKRWFGAEFAVLDTVAAEYVRQGDLALGGDAGAAPKCAAK